MENERLLKDIAFAAEEMSPSENPDDFSELMKRILVAVQTERQPFLWLWRIVSPHLGSDASKLGHDMASGRVAPTPRFRRSFVKAVKDWTAEEKASHG